MFGAGISTAPKPTEIIDTYETCRIYYIHSGCAYFITDSHEYLLEKNHLYFFPPNLPFSVKDNADSPMRHTYFDFIMSPPIILDLCIDLDLELYPSLEHIIQAANILLTENPSLKMGGNAYTPIFSCINAILAVITYKLDINYVNDSDILKALKIIHEKYTQNISVNELSAELGYNTDYFIRKFKSVMYITPYTYIRKLKYREAMRMREMGVQAKTIASALGYSDASALCHMLKSRF